MGASSGKGLLPLGGQPMAIYCLRTLATVSGLCSIILVVGPDQEAAAADVLQRYGPWPVPIRPTRGGAERQDSVAAGLALIDGVAELVLVHDAARPFVSRSCVEACIEAAAGTGAAIVAVPSPDTVKRVNDSEAIVETLDRHTIWLAQTPQVFRTALLRQAHERARQDGVSATDDAMLVERLGTTVHVVPGEPTNRKLTTPDDLRWAEWYVQSRRAV